jgi:ribosomal protein L37AE/L43A
MTQARIEVIRYVTGTVKNGRFHPTSTITDRAKRYRAQNAVEGPKRCFACGNPRPKRINVGHIDGNESNGHSRNLAYVCTSCNGKMASTMLRRGVGIRTRQFNPGGKTPSYQAYYHSLKILQGEEDGNLDTAIKTVHQTSPAKRSEYASRIWEWRKKLYGPSGRKDRGAVSF